MVGLVVLTSAISAVSSYAYLADGRRFGGDSLILVSLLRSLAPMAAGSALLLALALWAESSTPANLARDLERALKRALPLALPGFAASVAVAFGVCFAMAAALLGSGKSGPGKWLADIRREDVAAGLAFALLDTALIWVLARRFAVRLRSTPISLPAKLIVIVTVTVPLRATLALIFAPLMPG